MSKWEWFAGIFTKHPLAWLGFGLGVIVGDQWCAHVGYKILAQSLALVGLSFCIGAIYGVIVYKEKKEDVDEKT